MDTRTLDPDRTLRRASGDLPVGQALRDENNRLLALVADGRAARALLDDPSLTPRQRRLASRAVADAERARGELVRLNERLVRHWSRRYHAPGVDPDDLHQAGLAGLLHGIDRFDLAQGTQLSTYVTWWIRQALQRHTARAARTAGELSLDAPLASAASATDTSRSLHDVLTDRLAPDPADAAADAADHEVLRDRFAAALAKLPAQERLVLEATLAGTPAAETQAALKLSAETCRRLAKRGWARLRHPALHLLDPADHDHEPGVTRSPRLRAPAEIGVLFEDPPPARQKRRAASPLVTTAAYAHGTRPRYVFGPDERDAPGPCRCEPCRAANRAYARERDRRVRAGRKRTPATPVREHLEWLAAHGVGKRAVAAASGVALSAIDDLRQNRTRLVDQSTAEQILAVTPAALAPGALVDATAAHADVDRLLAAGWTRAAIAAALGSNTPALQLGRTRVKASTAARLAELVANLASSVPA
jgi:RNA polymerase sigma factor (sigma-70 family)